MTGCCKTFNKSSLLILEEPELFLHPHAKRMLSGILKDFLEIDGVIKNQIIVTICIGHTSPASPTVLININK